eukprot:CAMPEP_0113481800 /NCGR_PEP_ID=MMETSP0014_2-20120614/22592_1 /TAXON_ID=2857 /ORGANISM="Nitzschia sp." /LENGTH=897 /DNA_ID=CAMNT_0000375301 /DNA_START=45 /DNA_END=2738 /DNA_ORIENTATION=+ /assembly_acc=CAM_ASM_000159
MKSYDKSITAVAVLAAGLVGCVVAATAASITDEGATMRIVKSLVEQHNNDHFNSHRILSSVIPAPKAKQHDDNSNTPTRKNLNHHRILEDEDEDEDGQQDACDGQFIQCLPNAKCVDCFATLETEDIDWTGVSSGTSCDDVVGFLMDGNHCKNLKNDETAKNLFCNVFDACVVWDEDNGGSGYDNDDEIFDPDYVDCSKLTECYWEGMHDNWIGDGVCQDNTHGCYNTEICDYDGGDCCEDTCEIDEDSSSYTECGHDGYACRDPQSDYCDPALSRFCPSNGANGGSSDKKDSVICDSDEIKYRLVMFDSFGDGWDTTALTISPEGTDDVTFKGGLVNGFQGTEFICLSRTAQCYNVKTEGGTWGVEVSWEIKPLSEGSPSIAGGAAPADCDFSVAGDVCEKTCDGSKPDIDPTNDPDYRSFKDLYNCIEDKCIIQLGACNSDASCKECFGTDDVPDYCYGIDSFVAVVDCTMCSCTEKAESQYCAEKTGPGHVIPPPAGEDSGPKECTPRETMAGASAIMDFGKCSDMDEMFILVSDFDQNNFGTLDKFESCAHSFRDEAKHGGRKALECMKILKDTITSPVVEGNDDAPVEAISALAKNLYDHAETFCDCSKKASDACPLCPNFMNFKTLLYESLDACESLDAIDCASWNEFWKPCAKNLEDEFGDSDFTLKDQCDFVKNGCGDEETLTFPAFRRLDCEEELNPEAWGFYKKYSKKCLKGADGIPPSGPVPITPTTPVPAPSKTPSSPTPSKPTPKPYVPSDDPKPYVPSDDDDDDSGSDSGSSDSPSDSKKKSHWLRNFMIIAALGGVGYYFYKKRSDGFNFVQYRRRVFGNRFGGGFGGYGMVSTDGGDIYSNLNSSTTFEPPQLPPTPQMVGGPSMMMPSGAGQQTMGTDMT